MLHWWLFQRAVSSSAFLTWHHPCFLGFGKEKPGSFGSGCLTELLRFRGSMGCVECLSSPHRSLVADLPRWLIPQPSARRFSVGPRGVPPPPTSCSSGAWA